MRRVLDFLLPPVCVACGVGVDVARAPLCPLCRSRLPAMPLPRCPRCGATDTSAGRGAAPAGCLECATWPSALRSAAAPFRMEGVALTVVHGLKYRGWTGLAALMAQAMAGDARRLGDGGALRLVPVPLSSARRRERGFNQARLIADILGREIGWPVAELLRRPRTGRRQVGLGREDRMANVAGRFRVEEMPAPAGRPVLLVDDVVTTGATAAACAAALHAAGVPCAGVVSFARSLGSLDGEEIL